MEEKWFDLKKILKSVLISILFTVVCLIIFSILLTYTKLQENTIPVVTTIITSLSILIGSTLSTLNIKRNGLISGATIALIYIYIIYFLSSIITKNFSLNGYSILMIITSLLSGAIGGIIGVNIK